MDLTETERERLTHIDGLLKSTRAELAALKLRAREPATEGEHADIEIQATKLYKRLDGLGREKGGLLGKLSKLGPGNLNKRDRRAIKRIEAGISRPGTIPKKRLEKLLAVQPAIIKTYVAADYRSEREPGDHDCVCCPDKRGHGHIFCHAIHDLNDKGVYSNDIIHDAMRRAGVKDGDEFEVIVRKTGRRPFGDKLLVHIGPRGNKKLIRTDPKEKS